MDKENVNKQEIKNEKFANISKSKPVQYHRHL